MDVEKKNLETKIGNVIVYQTGVQITLMGKINLSIGGHQILISDLPYTIDKESIRVKGMGEGRIVNISVEYNSKKEYRKEEHQKIQEERESLEKLLKRQQRELERIRDLLTKFQSTEDNFYSDWSSAYAYGEAKLNNFIEFDDKFSELFKSNSEKIEKIAHDIKETQENLQVVHNKMNKLGPVEKITNFYEVNINLNAVKEGEFLIEVRYTMKGAWWQPFYDVVLTEENATLTMMANVYNRTGLDWEDVEMEISTASLQPISLLRPNPMILKEYIPYIPKPPRRMSAKGGLMKRGIKEKEVLMDMISEEECEMDEDAFGLSAGEGYFEGAPEEPEPQIEESFAEVSENIGVQSFKIPEKLTIESDKNPHPVNLTKVELTTKKKYFWSSAAPNNVIIQDQLKNGDLLLLAGNVKIYFEEEFLGETSIPVIAPKEEFKLGTRISYALKVDKKLVDRSKAKKAIKGKLRNNYEYKITIKNLNEVEENLTLYDRIPHSSHESIKVEVDLMEPEQDKIELGVFRWNFAMKGVNEKSIHYKYHVEYKSGLIISPELP